MSKWCSVTNGCIPDRYRKKKIETVELALRWRIRAQECSSGMRAVGGWGLATFLQEGIDQAVVERYPIWIDAAKPASCENALATPKSGAVRSNAFYVQF